MPRSRTQRVDRADDAEARALVQPQRADVAARDVAADDALHLGRPQYAYRAVIGLRHSWLSREIVAFGLFAVAAQAQPAPKILVVDMAKLYELSL